MGAAGTTGGAAAGCGEAGLPVLPLAGRAGAGAGLGATGMSTTSDAHMRRVASLRYRRPSAIARPKPAPMLTSDRRQKWRIKARFPQRMTASAFLEV